MIDKELLHAIVAEYNGDINGEFVDFLYVCLSDINAVKNGIASQKKEIEALKGKIELCNKAIALLQSSCKHWRQRFHSDPSGNNDSSYECLICGKFS